MTLTDELDLATVKVNHHAKCYLRSHFVRQLSSEHTHTHTQQTDYINN